MTTVLKIGGSLRADPGRLRALLGAVADGVHGACIVVPGGGAFAEAVRAAQVRTGFDDAEAHRRALDAMGRMAAVFRALEPRLTTTTAPWAAPPPPLSAGEVDPGVSRARARRAPSRDGALGACGPEAPRPSPHTPGGVPCPASRDERSPPTVWDPASLRTGHPDIPETWAVTSDSLSLWLAARLRARRCILAKSVDTPPGLAPADLARLGLVDDAFPAFAARYLGAIEIWGPSGAVPVAKRAAA